jgi:hypothetical protein
MSPSVSRAVNGRGSYSSSARLGKGQEMRKMMKIPCWRGLPAVSVNAATADDGE